MSQTLKHPHAETSTRSSLPSTRVRVEEPNSEIQFTLFDGAELANLSISVFDGQLSDTSTLSDVDSDVFSEVVMDDEVDLSPLAKLSAPSEAVVDDKLHNNVPSGDWDGTRKSIHNYRLPRTNEDLSGPIPEDFDLKPTALS